MKTTASNNPGAPVGTELKEPVFSINEKEKIGLGPGGKNFKMHRVVVRATGVEVAARTWKDGTGRYSVQAEFRGVKDGAVQLHTADGRDIRVPLEQLSAVDRQFIKERQSQ